MSIIWQSYCKSKHSENRFPFHLLPSHLGLRNYVLYYNIVFPDGYLFPEQYTLMPNACGTLSFAFDGTDVTAELWGASLSPVPLGMEPNRYRILLLIQLSPYGLYQFTRQNQEEFAGRRLSLAGIDSALFHSLHQAFIMSETIEDLASSCDKILYSRMETPVISDALLLTAAAISGHHGQLPVKEAARKSGYSERQLNRLFYEQIGMNMKHYARLVRFNYVLKQMQKPHCFFAELSQQAGYFDQAHFDKDFKAISGVTPQNYLKTMSDFYYDGMEIYGTLSSEEE